jgi:signal transduction histidine kinase
MKQQLPSELSHLPLLQKLEWILLTIVTLVEIFTKVARHDSAALLLLDLAGIGIFIGLGWMIPHKYFGKIFYTAIEFGLILLLALIGKLLLFGMLVIVMVIRSCTIWTDKARSIMTALTFLFYVCCYTYRFLSKDFPQWVEPGQQVIVWLTTVSIFGLTILFLQLLVTALHTERQNQEELMLANEQLQNYALKIEELATLQERNRIAREIHDSLGHNLTVFNFHLAAALRLFHSNPSKAEALLFDLKEIGDNALQEVSRSVSVLRADPLAGMKLTDAIGDLVISFHQTTGVLPDCKIELPADLPDRYKMAIYRIVQESLTNICKYAAMTAVKIQIEQTGSGIEVIINDNGRGFDLAKNTTGYGLQGMCERVMLLSGRLEIKTAIDQGCQITAIIPFSNS